MPATKTTAGQDSPSDHSPAPHGRHDADVVSKSHRHIQRDSKKERLRKGRMKDKHRITALQARLASLDPAVTTGSPILWVRQRQAADSAAAAASFACLQRNASDVQALEIGNAVHSAIMALETQILPSADVTDSDEASSYEVPFFDAAKQAPLGAGHDPSPGLHKGSPYAFNLYDDDLPLVEAHAEEGTPVTVPASDDGVSTDDRFSGVGGSDHATSVQLEGAFSSSTSMVPALDDVFPSAEECKVSNFNGYVNSDVETARRTGEIAFRQCGTFHGTSDPATYQAWSGKGMATPGGAEGQLENADFLGQVREADDGIPASGIFVFDAKYTCEAEKYALYEIYKEQILRAPLHTRIQNFESLQKWLDQV